MTVLERLRLRVWPLLLMAIMVVGCMSQPTTPSASAVATGQPSETAAPTITPRAEVCDPGEPTASAPAGQVLVFFTCLSPPGVAGVTRPTDADSDEGLLGAAIDALLAGPAAAEHEQGLTSWFSSETEGALNGVTIDDQGVAVVDFADFSAAIPNASTTAGRLQLLSELRATILQFDFVESAEIQFDGNCGAFWIWLGAVCTPLTPDEA